MKTLKFAVSIISLLFILIPGFSQDSKTVTINPLEEFGKLVGGEWHLEGTYQVFEWGVGKKSIQSRSYFILDGESNLVSEGSWFWHPGEKVIKGFFTAINMPVEFFEYTSQTEDGKITSALDSFDPKGNKISYTETIEVTSQNAYEWSLLQGETKVMGGTFVRK